MTSRIWEIPGKAPNETKTLVQEVLDSSEIPSAAQLSWSGETLIVKVQKGGTSEFQLSVTSSGEGSQITETNRKVSMMHKPFVSKVESFVEEVLNKVQTKAK